ncbi:MAG: DUF2834 domain-containing protein [Cyanobacteria bacterium P01_G01_bin.38]
MTPTITTRRSTHKNIYLALAIFGSIVPWYFLIEFLQQRGNAAVGSFFAEAFANPVASALAADLLITCGVFFCFSFIELKRLGLSRRWLALYMGLTFGIGLSCSLPIFLYLRETQHS